LKGARRPPLTITRGVANAASFVSALIFIALVLYIIKGIRDTELLLGIWFIYSGLTASSIHPVVVSYSSAAETIKQGYVKDAVRPPFSPISATALAFSVPFTAPLILYAMIQWLLSVLEKAAISSEIDIEDIAEELPQQIGSAKLYIVSSVVPVLQPIALLSSLNSLEAMICALLRALSKRGLWDKPCTPDFVEVMIWTKPYNLAFDSKLLSEKWSIKD